MIDEKNVRLTKTRHIGLKVLIFGLFIGVVAVMITLYAVGFFSDGSGYVALAATIGSDGITYADGMSCTLYFQGNAFVVGNQSRAATSVYSNALKQAFMQTEAKTVYPQYASLAYLNSHLGEDVRVDEYVYSLLQDASGKSQQKKNFSLFAGPLYDEWERLASIRSYGAWVDDPDPIYDEGEAKYLSELTALINDESNFTLTLKENNTVYLAISDAYAKFRHDNGIESPVISLNILRRAYMIDFTVKALEKEGYSDGFLASEEGWGSTLASTKPIAHSLFGISEGKPLELASVALSGKYSFAKPVRFKGNSPRLTGYYQVSKDGDTHFRSPHLNIGTGMGNEYLLNLTLFDGASSCVELAYLANQAAALEDDGALNAYLSSLKQKKATYYRKDALTTYYVDESMKGAVTVYRPESTTISYFSYPN